MQRVEEVKLRPCEKKDQADYIAMNFRFMQDVRKEHPYWEGMPLPGDKEMAGVFDSVAGGQENIHGFMVERDGTSVGFVNWWTIYSVWAQGKVMMLDDLYIVPEERGRGTGKKVIEKLLDFARSHGYRRVQLHAELDNEGARHLYKKMGFEEESMVFCMQSL